MARLPAITPARAYVCLYMCSVCMFVHAFCLFVCTCVLYVLSLSLSHSLSLALGLALARSRALSLLQPGQRAPQCAERVMQRAATPETFAASYSLSRLPTEAFKALACVAV
jgi:hypothetical protein